MNEAEKQAALRALNEKAFAIIGEQMAAFNQTIERLQNILTAHQALMGPLLAEAVRENTNPMGSLERVEASMAKMMEEVRKGAIRQDQDERLTSAKVIAASTLEREFAKAFATARYSLENPAGGY